MKIDLKYFFLIFVLAGTLFALEVPKSTENEGMNKYERINALEKTVIKLAKEIQGLKKEIRTLKKQLDSF